jgi:hypothetical protein
MLFSFLCSLLCSFLFSLLFSLPFSLLSFERLVSMSGTLTLWFVYATFRLPVSCITIVLFLYKNCVNTIFYDCIVKLKLLTLSRQLTNTLFRISKHLRSIPLTFSSRISILLMLLTLRWLILLFASFTI